MKLINLVIVFCLLFACTDKTSIPADVIPREKMEKVLWDMMMADRFAAQYLVRDSTRINVTDSTFKLYSQVFSLNDITREDFVKSYKFYLTRPDLTKVMFDSILLRANRQKEELYQPKSTPQTDSLARDSISSRNSIARDSVTRDSLARKSIRAADTTVVKP